jgi:uncharacterized protein YdbL (DUF1318 family)
MKSSSLVRLALVLIAAFCSACVTQAQDLAALRARMDQRLPAILALKDKQVIGETNRGYLEVRGAAQGDAQQVVADENSDRRKVYAALAAQTGANADEVGRQRAGQLAGLAKRGHWVQEANGEWRQK